MVPCLVLKHGTSHTVSFFSFPHVDSFGFCSSFRELVLTEVAKTKSTHSFCLIYILSCVTYSTVPVQTCSGKTTLYGTASKATTKQNNDSNDDAINEDDNVDDDDDFE